MKHTTKNQVNTKQAASKIPQGSIEQHASTFASNNLIYKENMSWNWFSLTSGICSHEKITGAMGYEQKSPNRRQHKTSGASPLHASYNQISKWGTRKLSITILPLSKITMDIFF
jgi:hypothetical protein